MLVKIGNRVYNFYCTGGGDRRIKGKHAGPGKDGCFGKENRK